MMNELRGCDFSHYQNEEYNKYLSSMDFIIHKLSEGTSFIDEFAFRRASMFAENKPFIFYHFVRDRKNIMGEISHFARTFCKCDLKHTIGIAIDCEGAQFEKSKDASDIFQVLEWLKNSLGKRPIFYGGDLLDASFYYAVRDTDSGLWVARYRSQKPVHACDFWQYSSTPFDKDLFFGDMEKMKSFLKG